MHTFILVIAAIIATAVFFISPLGQALTKKADAEADALKASAEKSVKNAANDVASRV